MFVLRSLPFLAALIGAATAATTPPSGAVVVKPGDNLQNAVNANAGKTIFLQAGKYTGPIVIKSKITLMGASENEGSYGGNKATITINRSQESGFDNHHTAAVQVEADGVKFYNINFENTWRHEDKKKNQALAVSTQGDQIGFYGCKFDSFQDTVETEGKGGRATGKQVFAKCLIQGATDFIFGKTAAAWFETCDIRVKNAGKGWVTGKWLYSQACRF
jgi:pectinesterase